MAPVVHGGRGTAPGASPGSQPVRRRRRQARPGGRGIGPLRFAVILALAVGVAVAFHAFAFTAVRVASGSMKPTLLVGDSLLVNRLAYGSAFRNCLFGWCPDPPPIGHLPERGDVVVFRDGASAMLICKRIIGIPGDEIEVLAGRLYLNGERLPSRPGNMFHEIYEAQGQLGYTPLCANADARPGGFCLKPAQVETLPNGVEYDTLQIGMSAADFMAPTVVPPGSYFVMGDNRDNSADSRAGAAGGGVDSVRIDDIVGRVDAILFSTAADTPLEPWTIRRDRTLLPIADARLIAAH